MFSEAPSASEAAPSSITCIRGFGIRMVLNLVNGGWHQPWGWKVLIFFPLPIFLFPFRTSKHEKLASYIIHVSRLTCMRILLPAQQRPPSSITTPTSDPASTAFDPLALQGPLPHWPAVLPVPWLALWLVLALALQALSSAATSRSLLAQVL